MCNIQNLKLGVDNVDHYNIIPRLYNTNDIAVKHEVSSLISGRAASIHMIYCVHVVLFY